MQWFRFYDEVLDDPKVQRLPPTLFKFWANVLCLANKGTPRGTIPNNIDHIAYRLRVSPEKAASILCDLTNRELLSLSTDGLWVPHNWQGRQRKSDDVALRVAKHRNANTPTKEEETLPGDDCNVSTFSGVTVAREEQNRTDTESEAEQSRADTETDAPAALVRVGYPPKFERFWGLWSIPPSKGHGSKKASADVWKRLGLEKAPDVTLTELHVGLTAWQACDRWQRGFVKDCQRWLAERGWEDEPPDDGPARAIPNGVQELGYSAAARRLAVMRGGGEAET